MAKFPGPLLNAVTVLPELRSMHAGTYHHYIVALHEKYGSVVRVAPNQLVFNTSQAFQDIYAHRKGGEIFNKDRTLYQMPMGGTDSLVTTIDPSLHARQRKMFAPAFSDRAVRDQEAIVTDNVNRMLEKIDGQRAVQRDVDMRAYLNYVSHPESALSLHATGIVDHPSASCRRSIAPENPVRNMVVISLPRDTHVLRAHGV